LSLVYLFQHDNIQFHQFPANEIIFSLWLNLELSVSWVTEIPIERWEKRKLKITREVYVGHARNWSISFSDHHWVVWPS
jgi:hypothetical protein